MKRIALIAALVITGAITSILPAAAQAPDRLDAILQRGSLRVGTTLDTPVFSMRNAATGAPEGFRHRCDGEAWRGARRQDRNRQR